MNTSKIIYLSIAIFFLVAMIILNHIESNILELDCSEIQKTEIIQKKVSQPFLRKINILKIVKNKKEIFIQTEDEGYVQEIEGLVHSCKKTISIEFYKKERRKIGQVFFVSKSSFGFF